MEADVSEMQEGSEMTPYYTEPGIEIYHGDCRDILPGLGAVDLVLTDPPYGIGYQSNSRGEKFDAVVGDTAIMTEWLDLVSCNALAVFCRWDVLGDWRAGMMRSHNMRGCIVWSKGGGGLGDLGRSYAPDYELCLYATSDSWHIPGKRHGSVWQCQGAAAGQYAHPTQKPVGIMKLAIERLGSTSRSGDGTILDPFMGSGTTLRAAKDLGRKAIGIEIEETYCEIAVKRLKQEVLGI